MNDVNDEEKMTYLMKETNPKKPFNSAMYGVLTIFMEYIGYIAIASYVYQYQKIYGIILFIASWNDIFNDSVIATAILDRLVHHSTVIKITGPSYRIKDLIEASK